MKITLEIPEYSKDGLKLNWTDSFDQFDPFIKEKPNTDLLSWYKAFLKHLFDIFKAFLVSFF